MLVPYAVVGPYSKCALVVVSFALTVPLSVAAVWVTALAARRHDRAVEEVMRPDSGARDAGEPHVSSGPAVIASGPEPAVAVENGHGAATA